MKIKVTITETLERTIFVEANSKKEALELAEDFYEKERIVLDNDDFVSFDVSIADEHAPLSDEKIYTLEGDDE